MVGKPPANSLYFYPRSPCGERLTMVGAGTMISPFLSTLSLRRATCLRCCAISCITISIHALLAESDLSDLVIASDIIHFYPRSPCGERHILPLFWHLLFQFLSTLSLRRATMELNRTTRKITFLSTLSLRRATAKIPANIMSHLDFYPRSPCGERPY